MSTEKKITEEQLKSLQETNAAVQQLKVYIGDVEGQKHILLHNLVTAQDELQKTLKSLEEEYGKVSINIQDGSYSEVTEEQA
jgi:hypothetical protein